MRALAPLVVILVTFDSAGAERILSHRASWNASKTRIHTDLLVQKDDGTLEMMRVPGGVVDGIGMRVIPMYIGAAPDPYWEFVRSTTNFGGPTRWKDSSCVLITPDAAGAAQVPALEEFRVFDEVVRNWETVTRSCSYLTFVLEPPEDLETKFDGKNVLKFRETSWCRPATDGDPEECYPPRAAAITTLYYVEKDGDEDDGVLLDADIEFNGFDNAIAIDCETLCRSDGNPLLSQFDLANTATHELGHLVGLDHPCYDGATNPRPVDDMGVPIPNCEPESALSLEIIDSTMYNFADPREVKKISPEQDDIDGFCAIYPLAANPGECQPADIDDGCCSVAVRKRGEKSSWGAAAGIAAVLVLLGTMLVSRRRGARSRGDVTLRETGPRR